MEEMPAAKLAPVSLSVFYGANRDFANAFSVRVTLKNPVEPEPLRRALDKAMTRYPYFAVRLAVRGEELVPEDNPLPVSIVKGPNPSRIAPDRVLFVSPKGKTHKRRNR